MEKVVTAALLHDVGNIVKITFDIAPDFFAPEGVAYWQARQAETIAKHGADDHVATACLLRELGVSEEIIAITEAADVEFLTRDPQVITSEKLIMHYSDMRVGLFGVVSLKERITDLHQRYVPHRLTSESIDLCFENLTAFETELFADSELTPADITDERIAPVMETLLDWEVVL